MWCTKWVKPEDQPNKYLYWIFLCMRDFYRVKQLRFGDCLLQQLELVTLTNKGKLCEIEQKRKKSALFRVKKKKAVPGT